MYAKECIAMILAGGRGQRLGALTRYYSKPAVHFGGNHRIIDFTLRNCNHSRIDTVGVLSQHFTADLRAYIEATYEPMAEHSDMYMLPPQTLHEHYNGTADAVYKNIEFIERFGPENVLVLPGDYIYDMDYNEILDFHKKTGADVTVASVPVPINDAPKMGIINVGTDGRVHELGKKPSRSKTCLASMGIFVFKWSVLKQHLLWDNTCVLSRHDFSGDILPSMLHAGESVYAYQFSGFWRNIETVTGLWEANMDLLNNPALYRLSNCEWEAQVAYGSDTPNFIARGAVVRKSIIAGQCSIFGKVEHSVLGDSITVSPGAEIIDSVILPGVYIGNNAKIYHAVVGTGAVIMDNAVIGADIGTEFFTDHSMCSASVSLISPWAYIEKGTMIQNGADVACRLSGVADCAQVRKGTGDGVPAA